jgi:hypothetical protein
MNYKKLVNIILIQILVFKVIANNFDQSTIPKNDFLLHLNTKSTIKDSLINLELICSNKIGSNDFFKTLDSYPSSLFLFKKELFLLNSSENKLIIIDLDKKTTRTNSQINNVIKEKSTKYFGSRQIIISDKYILIGFLRAVICLTKEGVILGEITLDENINHIAFYNDSVSIFTADEINSYNINGSKLETYKNETTLTGRFLNFGKEVFNCDVDQLCIYNIEILDKVCKETTSMFNIDVKDPYLAYVSNNYALWYSYMNRNKLLLIDKFSGEILKKVIFNKKNFNPTLKEVEFEEGNPNFNVMMDDLGLIYLVTMKNKVIEVYRSTESNTTR